MALKAKDFPTLPFESASAWERWLAEHHASQDGVRIKIAKKASGIASTTYDEALDVALSYGWIDGQRNSLDDHYFLQKFTPRQPRSLWSKRNIEKVTRLTAEGRMQPSGLAQVEAAQNDGRWDAAYDSPKNMAVPEDFLKALEQNPPAKVFFKTLGKSATFAIGFRLATAKKPETRQRRLEAILAMLERGEFR